MFFILSKVLGIFTSPGNIILILLLTSFFIKKSVWKKRLRVASIVVFLIFGNGFLYSEVMRAWEVKAVSINNLPDSCMYGIILGGAEDTKREPNDRLFVNSAAERMIHPVDLYKAGKIKKILFTGGNSRLFEDAEKDNSQVMEFYIRRGIPAEDIIIESSSRNTRQNAINTAELLSADELTATHILITSAFHMRRSVGCFQNAGIKVEPFACHFLSEPDVYQFEWSSFMPRFNTLVGWDLLLKEMVGYVTYDIVGYL